VKKINSGFYYYYYKWISNNGNLNTNGWSVPLNANSDRSKMAKNTFCLEFTCLQL